MDLTLPNSFGLVGCPLLERVPGSHWTWAPLTLGVRPFPLLVCNVHNDPQESLDSFHVSSDTPGQTGVLEWGVLKGWSLLTSDTSTGLCRSQITQNSIIILLLLLVNVWNLFKIHSVIVSKGRSIHVWLNLVYCNKQKRMLDLGSICFYWKKIYVLNSMGNDCLRKSVFEFHQIQPVNFYMEKY